ncbi:MAG: cyclic nucleotide-binding domain-containing protein [Chloroflexi bacterium]|nr:cyclic nucleotide-binding domain-containing protein [Chloroflexota bacterium]
MAHVTMLHTLGQNQFFGSLDDAVLEKLIPQIEEVHLDDGDVLVKQGDPSDSLIILAEGKLIIQVETAAGKTVVVRHTEPGEVLGETALLTGQPRNATLVSKGTTSILLLSRQGFLRLENLQPEVIELMSQIMKERMQERQIACILAGILGQDYSEDACRQLTEVLEFQVLANGVRLIEQGKSADAMYIVIRGLLRMVAKNQEGEERVVGEVSPGGTLGELAMLTGSPYNISAFALRETAVVKLTHDCFESIVKQSPEIALPLTRLVANRALAISNPVQKIRDRTFALTLAVVPLQADIPLYEFGHELAAILGDRDETLYMDAEGFSARWGKPEIAQTDLNAPLHTALANWFDEQENHYKYMLFLTDPGWSNWTQRVVQHADRILLVGSSATSTGKLTPLEKHISEQAPMARTELVLLHPPHTEYPRDTHKWLAPRQLYTHHHVRQGSQVHLRRLARRLSGRSIGFVLSGGSARGYAHIGVARALEELGIDVDMVGGASMGSLIGGSYAYDIDHEELHDLARSMGSNDLIFDYTLPLVALNRTRKIMSIYRSAFGDRQIEDAWRSYFCVSANLTRSRAYIHEQGEMALAVRASTAIPAVFAPVIIGDDLLVDGGLINNFPVDIMLQKIEGGTVIGVSVNPPMEKIRKYDIGHHISGWHVAWNRLNPFAKKYRVPTLPNTLTRAMVIHSLDNMRNTQQMADLLILPDLRDFNSMKFDSYEGIITAGYETARPQIEAWLQNGGLPK